MVGDQLSKLRVTSADLLENGFKHLRLLLHNLSQLLELRIVAQEVQAVAAERTASASPSGTSSSSSSSTTCPTSTLASLCGCLEQVYGLVAARSLGSRSSGTRVATSGSRR